MRFLIDPVYHDEMRRRNDHSHDCYVRPGEYLHHLYVDGVKYVVAQAMQECLQEAQTKRDTAAVRHLELHIKEYEVLYQEANKQGILKEAQVLGDAPPEDEEGEAPNGGVPEFIPPAPRNLEDTGLSMAFLSDLVLRTIYNRGKSTGAEISAVIKIPYPVMAPVFANMRKLNIIDMVGQKSGGLGDAAFEYEIKPPKGTMAVEDALKKTEYVGPAPVPFLDYVESIKLQTVKNLVVTRRNIKHAFSDLIITDEMFAEIGPAINSAQSIFFFGYPGNGKTSVAERITRLMGTSIYIPYAIEANGVIIKVYDQIVHQPAEEASAELSPTMQAMMKEGVCDTRFVKIRRPTIIVGGELTMEMLDLKYNEFGKFYEAPVHMKANGGIFMIDDFGRQQLRPMDLLNRWIVPLEKRYDYLTTVTGIKIEVPFDQLLIFSTNLDPQQLADEAFLRRIKFKIEIKDPGDAQWRKIWQLVCRGRNIKYDDCAIDYLVEKWYKPFNRPFRMCHPRDLLDQMINIAKYNIEKPTLNPDLIDAGCTTYFVSTEKKDFGAKVRLE
jgi:hypothetical protein